MEDLIRNLTAERVGCEQSMNPKPRYMEDEMLIAKVRDDVICVEDTEGGVWWPSEEAWAAIKQAAKEEAIRICEEEPMRGRWKD